MRQTRAGELRLTSLGQLDTTKWQGCSPQEAQEPDYGFRPRFPTELVSSAGDYFGDAVAIFQNTILTGAQYENGHSGAAYVYGYNSQGGIWQLTNETEHYSH